MIKKFTIYGERCSGTSYLELLIKMNFKASITWDFQWKHFFGHIQKRLKNRSGDTLFICIVRDIHPWLNSLYQKPWHLPSHLTSNVSNFLEKPVYSIGMPDQHIYTGGTYKNIFELRHIKLKFLLDDLPKLVNHYILIKYEDLIDNFTETLNKIRDKGLEVRNPAKFPVNIKNYVSARQLRPYYFNKLKKNQPIPRSLIISHKNLIQEYEKQLGYLK